MIVNGNVCNGRSKKLLAGNGGAGGFNYVRMREKAKLEDERGREKSWCVALSCVFLVR